MAPTHYWTDPCGLGDPRTRYGVADFLCICMVLAHTWFAFVGRFTDHQALYYQRIIWVRSQLFSSIGDRIGQVQTYRSNLMVLGSMISFSGFGATAMAQMVLVQKDEFAKIRSLVPFAMFIVAIAAFGFVGVTMHYVHWLSMGTGDKVGCNDGCEGKCKVATHEKQRRLDWDPDLCNRLCSLVNDSTRGQSVAWQCQRMGLAFMLWPYSPWISFVMSVIMLQVLRSNVRTFTSTMQGKYSMKYLAECGHYKPILPPPSSPALSTPTPDHIPAGSLVGGRLPAVLGGLPIANRRSSDGDDGRVRESSLGSAGGFTPPSCPPPPAMAGGNPLPRGVMGGGSLET